MMTMDRVFLDLTSDGSPIGRLVFQLNTSACPRTSENFRVLCTGEKGFGLRGCSFFRVIPGFVACSGDFETDNETREGGRSSYHSKYFDDENFELSHDGRGILAMDNFGWPNTNGSRFYVTFDECKWMNEYHVAFGRVVEGWNTLDRLEELGIIEGNGAQKGRTKTDVRIVQCGLQS